MKKKMIVLLAALCAVVLAGGCGGKNENGNDSVKLGEYKGLELTLGSYEVTDEDVKNHIETKLTSYPVYEDTGKKKVEEGDIVNIDYEGLKDGVAFDGGTAEGANLEIGSNSFIDGFEDGLVGKKVGEKVELNLTFPEDYQNPELAGQAVVFKVTINKIVKENFMTYDTMTDDFVAGNFVSDGYESVDDMKKGVREELESNNESNKQTDIQNAIFEKLHETSSVTLPDGLLEQRIQEYMDQFTENLKTSYNMELADYLSSMGTTEEEFDGQVRQYIEESLTNQLLLEEIAKKENIQSDEEGLNKYKQDIISDYGYEDEDALVEQYGEDYIKNAYISDKAMQFIIDNAKITYDANVDTNAEAAEPTAP
ncbi:MAG: trigger factor [Lachnospiraceae bacterium]|nr:trigger factor [Lachnospiraceae bacterium]